MWFKDQRTEQLLREVGMKFEWKTGIPIARLKVKESLCNNARKDALDPLRVERYASDMQRGIDFPGPVVNAGLIILAGNQRTNAAIKAGRKIIDAFVVSDYTQEQYDNFIRLDNNQHGKSLSEDELIDTCVELHRKHGRPMSAINMQYFGGNAMMYAKLTSANQRATVSDRLKQKGVAAHKLSSSQLERMHSVVDDNVLRDVAHLVIDSKIGMDVLNEVVTDIGKQRTESDRKAIVTAKKVEIETKSTPVKMQPKALISRQLRTIKKFLEMGNNGSEFPILASLFDGSELKEAMADLNFVLAKLSRLKEKR